MIRLLSLLLVLLSPGLAYSFGVDAAGKIGGVSVAPSGGTYFYSGGINGTGGWTTTQSQDDGFARGTDQINPATAGEVTELGVHLASVGTATALDLSIYFNESGGQPDSTTGTSCTVNSPTTGWNNCIVSFAGDANDSYRVWYIPNGTVIVDQSQTGDGRFASQNYGDAWPASLPGDIHGGVINALRLKIE